MAPAWRLAQNGEDASPHPDGMTTLPTNPLRVDRDHLLLQPDPSGIRCWNTLNGRTVVESIEGMALLLEFLDARRVDALLSELGVDSADSDSLSAVGEYLTSALEQGLLVEVTDATAAPGEEGDVRPIELDRMAVRDVGVLPDDEPIRLRRGCLLRVIDGELACWAPAARRYVALPPAVALLLVRLCQPTSLGTFLASLSADAQRGAVDWQLSAEEARRVLAELCALGVVLRGDPWVPEPEPTPAMEALQRSFARPSGAPRPRQVASGKIPVYCVYAGDRERALGTDHSPLALGMLVAYAKAYKDGLLCEHYDFLQGTSGLGLAEEVGRHERAVVLFSDYQWTLDANLEVSAAVKTANPRCVTIHGGPSAPKYEGACDAFLAAHPHVDIVVRGEGEVTVAEVLERLLDDGRSNLGSVSGLTFRHGAGIARTPDRKRMEDLSVLPSPYLAGWFDDAAHQWLAAVIETNRGCPYGCTFCDWGSATLQKIRRFPFDRVLRETEWLARHRIPVLWIADANFGIFDRDVQLAEGIASIAAEHGYPKQVTVNYAKNATERLAAIIRTWNRQGLTSQGIMSIQSTDPETLRVIRRSNIKTERYDDLVQVFRRENLPLSTDLMIGLPGSTVASFRTDLQYFFDRVVPVKAYLTRLLPNSPMADPDYIEKHRIAADGNGYLRSTSSYTEDDLREMTCLARAYNIHVDGAVLRYLLYYLQWDWGLPAVEVLSRLSSIPEPEWKRYPYLAWLTRFFVHAKPSDRWDNYALVAHETTLPMLQSGDWRLLYRDVEAFVDRRCGIRDPLIADVVLRVQEAVMPGDGKAVPVTVDLKHDFVAYFLDRLNRREPARRLGAYPPGTLVVTDPNGNASVRRASLRYETHTADIELASPLVASRAGAWELQPHPAGWSPAVSSSAGAPA